MSLAIHYGLAGASVPVYWVLQYVPAGSTQQTVNLTGQLCNAEQFILGSGVFMADETADTITLSSPLMKKLYPNDLIVLSIKPDAFTGGDPLEFSSLVKYMIK